MCKALPLERGLLNKVHWNLVYPLLMAPEPTLDWKNPDKPNSTTFFCELTKKTHKTPVLLYWCVIVVPYWRGLTFRITKLSCIYNLTKAYEVTLGSNSLSWLLASLSFCFFAPSCWRWKAAYLINIMYRDLKKRARLVYESICFYSS